MPKNSKCKKGWISIGEATCQTSEDEKIPKLANLSASAFPSQNIWEQWKIMCYNRQIQFFQRVEATKEEKNNEKQSKISHLESHFQAINFANLTHGPTPQQWWQHEIPHRKKYDVLSSGLKFRIERSTKL